MGFRHFRFSGKYLRAEIYSFFFETFFEDRKIHYLRGNIIFISIGAYELKLCPNDLKPEDAGQGPRGHEKNISNFLFEFKKKILSS